MLLDSYKLLGEAPKMQDQEQIFDRIVHTFSVDKSWFSEEGTEWLKEAFAEMNYSDTLSKEKQWWAYVLLLLEHIFKKDELQAGQSFCRNLLYSVEEEDLSFIMQQANIIGAACNACYPYFLLPRLSELRNTSSNYGSHPVISAVLDKLDAAYAFIAKNIPEGRLLDETHLDLKDNAYMNHVSFFTDILLQDIAFHIGARETIGGVEGYKQAEKEYVESVKYVIAQLTSIPLEEREAIARGLADILDIQALVKLSADYVAVSA